VKWSVLAPLSRRREIEAAIVAYNAADPEALLPSEASRLLVVMFPSGDVCQRSVAHFMEETGDRRKRVARLLRVLEDAGFLSTEHSRGRIASVYRLHLPPLVRR
jgi:hypothetical protein